MAGHALRREVRQFSIAPHRTLWRVDHSPPSPACDAPRILPAKPSDQISSNAKAVRVTGHDRDPRPNPRSAFRIWNSACSSPQGRPAKSALTQNASRTSCPLNARHIVMARRAPRGAFSSPYCASSRVIERHTAAPAFPLLPVFFPPKLSGQITPTRQLQHFVPPYDFLTKRKNRRAIPAFLRDCAAVRHIDYAFASVSMAWANILTLSMNFSQSTYSSGIWQVSTSPGKLMPNATVLGIMRE